MVPSEASIARLQTEVMSIRTWHEIPSMSFLSSHYPLVISMSGELVFSWHFKGNSPFPFRWDFFFFLFSCFFFFFNCIFFFFWKVLLCWYRSRQRKLLCKINKIECTEPGFLCRTCSLSYFWEVIYGRLFIPLEPDFISWWSEPTLCLVHWSATPGNGWMSNIYPCGIE